MVIRVANKVGYFQIIVFILTAASELWWELYRIIFLTDKNVCGPN
jgi:hypothetical protein